MDAPQTLIEAVYLIESGDGRYWTGDSYAPWAHKPENGEPWECFRGADYYRKVLEGIFNPPAGMGLMFLPKVELRIAEYDLTNGRVTIKESPVSIALPDIRLDKP